MSPPTIDEGGAFGAEQSIAFAGGASGDLSTALYKAESGVTITATVSGIGGESATVTVNAGALADFGFTLAASQERNMPFAGTNTLAARDTWWNVLSSFDASTANVTLSVANPAGASLVLGTRGDAVLDQPGDFVNGIADLSALGLKYASGAGGSVTIRAEDPGATITGEMTIAITVTAPVVSEPSLADDTQISTSQASPEFSATFTEKNAAAHTVSAGARATSSPTSRARHSIAPR